MENNVIYLKKEYEKVKPKHGVVDGFCALLVIIGAIGYLPLGIAAIISWDWEIGRFSLGGILVSLIAGSIFYWRYKKGLIQGLE